MKAQSQAQEATRINLSDEPKFSGLLQRKCACGNHTLAGSECEEFRDKDEALLQRAAVNSEGVQRVLPIVHEVLQSPGQPLDPDTRAFFEPRFRHDFSQVRVHTDAKATASAQAVNAVAYTVGRDVVFRTGHYAPGTAAGQRLLGHELMHVAQQSLIATPARELGMQSDPDERRAEQAVAALKWGELRARYGEVASDMTSNSAARPFSVLPTPSPAAARIQRVQLTYDDGPDSAGNTRIVLSALNVAGARATFYLVGRRVAQGDNWRTVFDIAAAGHWLGNHAYDWNDATDNHIFLHGTVEERAEKILRTEWAIRDALIRGRDEAGQNNTWNTIPAANRTYIEDVIAHGTGRFRTPGFRSHWWTSEGSRTRAAIASVNQVLAATGLRPLAITEVTSWGVTREGVTVDPEDWRTGRTQAQVESAVTGNISSNMDTILLHSRLGAAAAATPLIVADIQRRRWSFDPTVQGAIGSVQPRPGFAGLSRISDPPTSGEIASARAFLRGRMLSIGPYLSGAVALGIFQLAQRAGTAEVDAFITEIRRTTIQTQNGPIPMANWMNANPEWRLFASFFENWRTNRPFPRIPGLTI
jgi:peptidoglycan/xylan/chitin deacetylase (PgdA/CDA1 family)